MTPAVKAEDVLRNLVVSLGLAAQERGIEEDLDALIEEAHHQAYQERFDR